MKQLVIVCIRGYQLLVVPILIGIVGQPTLCKYKITCSQYAILQIKKHGIIRGGYHSIQRILSCRSW